MANRIYPAALPNPVTPLGHDGADFRALTVDTDGKLQVVATIVGSLDADTLVLQSAEELHVQGSAISQVAAFTITSTDWQDVTGATLDIVLPVMSHILVVGTLGAFSALSTNFVYWRIACGAQTGIESRKAAAVWHAGPIFAFFSEIVYGAYTVKLQAKRDGASGALELIQFAVLVLPVGTL